MTNEVNEGPTAVSRLGGAVAPSRHAGEANAVLARGEQLSVGLRLRLGERHVRRARIEVLAHLRLSLAVVAVARGAMIGEVGACLDENGGSERYRVFCLMKFAGNRPMAHATGEK